MDTEAKATINVQRELEENSEIWPEPFNLEGLTCVFCGDTPTYPTMQCTKGHLICESEGQNYSACPGPDPNVGGRRRCGAKLLAVKLKWLRWLLEFGMFQCSEIGESTDKRFEAEDEASKHFIEDILNMDNSPCKINEPTSPNSSIAFKFLPEEEKIYLENKEEIDKAPVEFLNLFIRNGQVLPPDLVYRELCVIRDRLDLGFPLN